MTSWCGETPQGGDFGQDIKAHLGGDSPAHCRSQFMEVALSGSTRKSSVNWIGILIGDAYNLASHCGWLVMSDDDDDDDIGILICKYFSEVEKRFMGSGGSSLMSEI